jgi:hypothetical protein
MFCQRADDEMCIVHILLLLDLRYPAYTQEGGEKIVSQDRVLMDDDELTRFMNSEAGGKSLLWLNYFK